jgi:hypothetical protein
MTMHKDSPKSSKSCNSGSNKLYGHIIIMLAHITVGADGWLSRLEPYNIMVMFHGLQPA